MRDNEMFHKGFDLEPGHHLQSVRQHLGLDSPRRLR